jgi:hypothetical protein
MVTVIDKRWIATDVCPPSSDFPSIYNSAGAREAPDYQVRHNAVFNPIVLTVLASVRVEEMIIFC